MAYMTRGEVAAKVAWECGLAEALDYGLKATDMPDPELQALWGAMAIHYRSFQAAACRVEALLAAA